MSGNAPLPRTASRPRTRLLSRGRRPALAVVAVATAVVVLLAACGSGDGTDHGGAHSGSASPSAGAEAADGAYNAADVAFAKGMIPHHRQALEMSELAADRAGSAEVRRLAKEIEKAQGPEIRTLEGWLKAWGEEPPAEDGDEHGGHEGHSMPGMMTGTELEQLSKASGKAFDTAFLTLMIKHHEGALEMAGTERSDGAYAPARKLAGEIVTAQKAEIAEMKELLGG